jgi:beta-lactamase class A
MSGAAILCGDSPRHLETEAIRDYARRGRPATPSRHNGNRPAHATGRVRPMQRYIGPAVIGVFFLGAAVILGVRLTSPAAETPYAAVADSTAVERSVAPAAVQPASQSQDPMLALAELVQKEIAASNGRFGIAIKDLSSGQTLLMNDRMSFSAASLFKLPVMYEVFRQRQIGNINFDAEMTVTDAMAQYDLGTLAWPIGTRITVGTALERMITASDNVSAVMLLSLVGPNQINQEMAALGLESTSIGGSQLSTSARDMMSLMELITTGKAIDEKTSAEMLHLMRRQLVRNRIPALLPADTPVGNKTGNWEDYAHDVGMVFSPKSTFAIAVLTQGAGDADTAHATIARIARLTFDQFNRSEFNTSPLRMPLETMPSYASVPRIPANAKVPTFNGPPTASNQPGVPAAVVQQQTNQTGQRTGTATVPQPTASARTTAQPVTPAPGATTAPRATSGSTTTGAAAGAAAPTAPAPTAAAPAQNQPTPMPTPRGYDIVQKRAQEAQSTAATQVPATPKAPKATAQPTSKRS